MANSFNQDTGVSASAGDKELLGQLKGLKKTVLLAGIPATVLPVIAFVLIAFIG